MSAVRTPVGKFLGALSEFSAVELGALVVREAVRRAGIAPISGRVRDGLRASGGARAESRAAGRSARGPRGHGERADHQHGLRQRTEGRGLAAQSVMTGNAEIAVAGGMESMTNAPYLLPQARKGFRLGDAKVVDSMIKDGLVVRACDDQHMGMTGELVAEKYSITREMQDAYAVESHRRAAAAWSRRPLRRGGAAHPVAREEQRWGADDLSHG